MINEKETKQNIKAFKEEGLLIAIDDFGHGFTNLSLLEWIQHDFIKLDKTLIKNIKSKIVYPPLKGLNNIAKNIDAK